MTLRHATAACTAAVLLAACGGGGDGGGTDDNSGYLPLATGNRWVYDDGSESRVTGQRDAGGQRWWVLQDTQNGLTDEALLRKDAQGIYSRFEDPQIGTLTYTLIKLPVAAGTSYPAASYRLTAFFDYDGNGTADDVDLASEATVVGIESVVTPAGTFGNALHMRLSGTSTVVYRPSGTRALLSTTVGDDWFADGIGPVKGTSSDTLAATGDVTTSSYALTGYQVGTRTGGTLPPR